MTDFSPLLAQGNAWLFIPSAILLGALHGLEPGHSKTMMAAFIVAVRGTLGQAVLLGLSATLSHTAVVWIVALAGLYFGQRWDLEANEPLLQVASGVLILGVGGWMLWRTSQDKAACFHDHGGAQGHAHAHDHGGDGSAHDHGHDHDHAPAGDAAGQAPFAGPPGHVHGPACAHGHAPAHAHASTPTPTPIPAPRVEPDAAVDAAADPHARAHAAQIRDRFAGRHVTTAQIVMFGLTGGLIPCPASITVLLLCLQLKKIALGATLVLGFSVGLALTMVASGVVAALGVKHLGKRLGGESSRFAELARRAPYFSGGVIVLVGLYMGWQGLRTML